MSSHSPQTVIGVIILNWRKADETIACAESLAVAARNLDGRASVTLLIVDNGSQDNSAERLRDWVEQPGHEFAQLLVSEVNLGFAGGMNLGLERLKTAPPAYTWLLNDDTIIDPMALSHLFEAALAQPQVAIWGPTVIDAHNGKMQCAGGCDYNPLLGLEKPAFAGMPEEQALALETPHFDYIYGAAMFLNWNFLQSVGGLDERYFLFYEELELARQLPERGAMRWCREARVTHQGSKSSRRSREDRAFTAYHAALSAYRFTWRHFPLCLPTVVLSRLCGLSYYALREQNTALATAPLRALRSFAGSPESR